MPTHTTPDTDRILVSRRFLAALIAEAERAYRERDAARAALQAFTQGGQKRRK